MSNRYTPLNPAGQDIKRCKHAVATNSKVDTSWSIEDHRKLFEPEEHWTLRKSFMERHQHSIPEDELVCLAQVFVNVELLHCRYPLETTDRVKELSEGIADVYHEIRKNKLKRTFVLASDAAASKVQRGSPENQENPSIKIIDEDRSKSFKPAMALLTVEDVYRNIVLVNNSFEQTQQAFNRLGCGNLELTGSPDGKGAFLANIQVGPFILATVDHPHSKKWVMRQVKKTFLRKMSQYCYQLDRNGAPAQLAKSIVQRITKDDAGDLRGQTEERKLDESNLGFKMLQRLGWSGGSLGSKNQGIVDPINGQIKIGRQGFGGKPEDRKGPKKVYEIDPNFYRNMMRNFRDEGIEYDLVFSEEFTEEERKLLSIMSHQLRLKSSNLAKQFILYGRSLAPHEILERILVQKEPEFGAMYRVRPPSNVSTCDDELGQNNDGDSAGSDQSSEHNEESSSCATDASSRIFTPAVPIQTIEDVYNNIVLVNHSFEQTQVEFDEIGVDKMELLLSEGCNEQTVAQIQVGSYVLATVESHDANSAKNNVKKLFLKTMVQHCYQINQTKNYASLLTHNDEDFIAVERVVKNRGTVALVDDKRKKQRAIRRRNHNVDVGYYRQLIQSFRDNNIEYDWAFSLEFTQQERGAFHSIAQKLNLKSMSRNYGKADGPRQFILKGRKLTPHELLQRIVVKKEHAFCKKYTVKPPKSRIKNQ